MIELNKKTQQDFLNREWVQKLLDAGVDMSDAKYYLVEYMGGSVTYITYGMSEMKLQGIVNKYIPTYTVSELLYKLHEWIYPEINGVEYSGGLVLYKDAPFYPAYYLLTNGKLENTVSKDDYIYAAAEYPIESLASLLIQCHKKDIGIARKYTGDISDK